MFAPGKIPESVNCHACGAILDIAGRKGFAHVACNRCGAFSVVPLQFGDFLLLGSIGVGGVGLVYEAIDLPLNRPLALKILPKKDSKNPEFVDRFAREARFAAVNHPNVALVYSFGEHEGRYYLAMELLERGSLDDQPQDGQLPPGIVFAIERKQTAIAMPQRVATVGLAAFAAKVRDGGVGDEEHAPAGLPHPPA